MPRSGWNIGTSAYHARRAQRIHRPVPAIRRLDRDPRVARRLRNLSDQPSRVVVDPDTIDLTTTAIDPHDHRPMQMQIDTNELPPSDTVTRSWPSIHVGL